MWDWLANKVVAAPECSKPLVPKPTIGKDFEPFSSLVILKFSPEKTISDLTSNLLLVLPSGRSFPFRFLCVFRVSSIQTACPARCYHADVAAPITPGELCKLTNSSLRDGCSTAQPNCFSDSIRGTIKLFELYYVGFGVLFRGLHGF
jgi:hypothetical protein